MSHQNSKIRRLLSGILTMTMVASLLTAIVIANDPAKPTVHIDGLELRLVGETDGTQSIQALASVSVSDLERCTGAYVPLYYNEKYLTPSDWKTNATITSVSGTGNDAEDPLHHLFFRADESLYGKKDEDQKDIDPFNWSAVESSLEGISTRIMNVDPSSGVVSVQLSLRTDLEQSGFINRIQTSYRPVQYDNCINTTEKVTLGTVSFRIKEVEGEEPQVTLKKLADKFDGSVTGKAADGSDDWLFELYTGETSNDNTDKLVMMYLAGKAGSFNRSSKPDGIAYSIHVDSDDVIIKAEPVKKNITINSYQAFTDGALSDLALTMQKYADSVRTTYVSGKQNDLGIYWGDPATCDNMPDDGPGMFIRKNGSDEVYRFRWDNTQPGGFVLARKQGDDSYTQVDPSAFAYDPRGGGYTIRQYFTYQEKNGVPGGTQDEVLKAYPTPVEVGLTVTPIRVIGASVDHETITYKNGAYSKNEPDGAPTIYSGLDLATDAKLTLDTTLNGVVPAMPITWTPSSLTKADNTGIIGTVGTGNAADEAKWPLKAADFAAKTGIGSYSFETSVTSGSISSRYPWLTVSSDYDFTSMRHIVDVGENGDTSPVMASRYEMRAEAFEEPKGDAIGKLRVTIARRNGAGNAYEDMASGYSFRLFLPDGREVTESPNGWFGTSGSAGAWYDSATGASYTISQLSGWAGAGDKDAYQIVVSPGNLGASGTYQNELETLRRQINVGGWFGLQVLAPGQTEWSNLLTAYSAPRTNVYIESHTLATDATETAAEKHLFNYSGDLAGLMPFYTNSTLKTFVTLPADDSVATRYDATSGAQPGSLRQFAVGSWSAKGEVSDKTAPNWTKDETVTFGPDLFARTYSYSNYGTVVNPDTDPFTGYQNQVKDRRVTIKVTAQEVPETPDPAPTTSLLLTYEQSGDSITYTAGNEVQRVTFDAKQVGYTYQQIVTLTLTNNGDTEIRGLHIDVPTAASTAGVPGPYFNIISAPAVNLPAGASTTFQVSYVPNLPVGTYQNVSETRRIYIYDDTDTIRKDFEAVLKVTQGGLRRVDVVVHPGEEENVERVMGDASLVTGITTTDGADSYDGSAATSVYEAGDIFWVIVQPKDEYALLALTEGNTVRSQVYYINEEGDKVYLREYTSTSAGIAPAGSGTPTKGFKTKPAETERLFWAEMPDYSVTVHVRFYEPLLSKLRLSDLHAFAWDNEGDANWDDDAGKWTDTDPKTYEKTLHKTQEEDYAETVFDAARNEYIVILKNQGDGDNWCGVSMTLRSLKTNKNGVDPDYVNQDIRPNVVMRLDDGPGTPVGADTGDTSVPTTHHSRLFEAPQEDPTQNRVATKTVIITVSYDGTGLVPVEEETERVYKVRFVRKVTGEAKRELMAGNSPYGMIENDDDITDKEAAKAAFDVANRFAVGYTPKQAEDLTNIYWPEAWGDGVNYDKDESALFVYLGQEFFDPGAVNIYNNAADLIDGVEVSRTLSNYYAMDTSKTGAKDRFNVTALTITALDLGTVKAVGGSIPGETITVGEDTYSGSVPQFAEVKNIRPGIYRLTYTFMDYDGTTRLSFTRPLIVLAPNGDVNADLSLVTDVKDANALRKRFSAGLPLDLDDTVYIAADKLLYRYRIVDANNDRNVNEVDADLIREVTTSIVDGTLTQFYRPTEYTNFNNP